MKGWQMTILADANLWSFLSSIPWWAWVSIIVVIGMTVQQIMRMQHAHRERLAMIQRGINPSAHQENQ